MVPILGIDPSLKPYEGFVLPLHHIGMVAEEGFEPTTFGL